MCLQIPQIFYQLQSSVQAVLIGAVVEMDWNAQGIPSKSQLESWPLSLPASSSESSSSSSSTSVPCLTGDGHYLYLHGHFGLLKVGTGYGRTIKVLAGSRYLATGARSLPFVSRGKCTGVFQTSSLEPAAGLASRVASSTSSPGPREDTLVVLDPNTLAIEKKMELEGEGGREGGREDGCKGIGGIFFFCCLQRIPWDQCVCLLTGKAWDKFWPRKRYIHTYIHTYTHTYIHTYIHTHIHTYIHTAITLGEVTFFLFPLLSRVGLCCAS